MKFSLSSTDRVDRLRPRCRAGPIVSQWQASKKWSKRMYIYVYIYCGSSSQFSSDHGRQEVTSAFIKSLKEGWRGGSGGIRFRVVGSLSRIPTPSSPSASPLSSLVFPVCGPLFFSLSLGNWIVASNSARREPRGGSGPANSFVSFHFVFVPLRRKLSAPFEYTPLSSILAQS